MSVDRAREIAAPQVRFQVAVRSDESLPGIVVRSAREHVLPTISRILTAAGIDTYIPGAIVTLDAKHIPSLSHVLRQPASVIEGRVAVKVGKSLCFGELAFPIGTFETRLRRIGPRSLETDPHHRFAWMNRLLPCCSVTGEHLVSRCGACDEPLRWYRTWGIEFCESCRALVAASPLPPLSGEQMADYRIVSDLMSLDPATRERGRVRLAAGARAFQPGIAAQTALQMVSLLNGQDGLGGDIQQFLKLDPVTQADLVCRAGRVLLNWPHGLRDEFRSKVEQLGVDHEQFFLTWRSLKRFATPKLVGDEKAAMVVEGLPDLRDSIWQSFSGDGSVYSTQDAMRALGIDNGRTKKLAAVPTLVHITKPSRYRGNRQFKADAIDELRRVKDASTTFATVTESTGIPHYGVEQLAATGQLEFRDGEAMAIAYPRPFVSTESYRQLLSSTENARRRSGIPKDARRLSECSRVLGGGEKPWNLIIAALISGDLHFWSDVKRFGVRHIMVRPEEMRQFLGMRFDAESSQFIFSRTYAKREASEILTIDTPLLEASLEEHEFNFQKIGRARVIAKAEILKTARTVVSNAELGEHWGIPPKKVRHDTRVGSLRRIGYGWRRADAVAAGLIAEVS